MVDFKTQTDRVKIAAELFDLWDIPEHVGAQEKRIAKYAQYWAAYGARPEQVQKSINYELDVKQWIT